MYSQQLFMGLDFIHTKLITHRDIKPQNLFVNDDVGELKIGDFGCAIRLFPKESYSPYQITRFYRPPELLFGSEQYSTKVDIWSAICTMVEMVYGKPLFIGVDWTEQASKILDCLGAPTSSDLANMNIKKVNCKARTSKGVMPENGSDLISSSMYELMRLNLIYDPNKRMTGREIVKHAYFAPLYDTNNYIRSNGTQLIKQKNTKKEGSRSDKSGPVSFDYLYVLKLPS
uniref:Protein kinase domain-containing protein n=1 Tax=Rhabditophanes sp. KR3021 TaxID=114890 RepID=A0AC35UI10_9BILA